MKHIKEFVVKAVWIGRATVLALLVGSLAACTKENNPDAVVSPVTPVSPTPDVAASPTMPTADAVTTPLTDVVAIVTAPDKESLVNSQVQLTNVAVQSVIGDRTFWVGSSNNQRLLVVLNQALDTGSTEKALNVNAGQTLTINGQIMRLPSTEEAQKQWGLSGKEAEALENEQIYLQAQQVTVQ